MNDKMQRRGKLSIPFVGLCDGHVMSKVTQYAIEDAKICQGFSKVSLKVVQASLQKLLGGPKNQGRGGRNGKNVISAIKKDIQIFNEYVICFKKKLNIKMQSSYVMDSNMYTFVF
jgi:hypothetical protein